MNETAFPAQAFGGLGYTTGMTLRDYFAAKAMQGFIAYAIAKKTYVQPDNELANASYQLADAMLKAREA